MKHHAAKTVLQNITGIVPFEENEGFSVLVTGDKPELIAVVESKLKAGGHSYEIQKGRKFKGAKFIVHMRNVGTAFNADWEFVKCKDI